MGAAGLLALLLLLAAACGGPEPTDTPEPPDPSELLTLPSSGPYLVANLIGVNENLAVGAVVLTEGQTGTQVEVRAKALEPGLHGIYIHQGTCEETYGRQPTIGQIVGQFPRFVLEQLDVGLDGLAGSVTIFQVEDRGLEHFAEGHYVAVYGAGRERLRYGFEEVEGSTAEAVLAFLCGDLHLVP